MGNAGGRYSLDYLFVCPTCGQNAFGTVCTEKAARGGIDWDRAVGHCHGLRCGFTWARRDDWKVFVFTIKPRSRAEFERRMAEWRTRNKRRVRVTKVRSAAAKVPK